METYPPRETSSAMMRFDYIRRDDFQAVNWRYTMLGILFTVMAILIVLQMARIQLSPEAMYFLDQAKSGAGEWRTLYPVRGKIYDRWGDLLAGNVTVYEVGAELALVKNPATIALALSDVVDANYEEMFARASIPPSEDAVYALLVDHVTQQQKDRLDQLAREWEDAYGNSQADGVSSLAGLKFRPHLKRSYPEKSLAGNLLGFEGYNGLGYFGVEGYYQDRLKGVSRLVWVPSDPNKVEAQVVVPDGASLILTIDRAIQTEVEAILRQSVSDSGAESGTIVVMDPRTGEILAMATTPQLDLNEFWRYKEVFPPATPFNRAVSQTYEPGSVFKVLTMAAALDRGVVKPETTYFDTGVFEYGGITVRNWGGTVWGEQDMIGCMRHSINACLAWIATQLGSNAFYDYMQRFGIGHLTGIDLAQEVSGRLKIPGDTDWYEAELATNAFGQGVSVTPVQMVMAVSAIANDGQMVAPHVARSIIENGHQYDTPARVVGAPISAETAHTLTEMLSISLETESSAALVEGYRVAGKTGTAEISTPMGYTISQTNASFVGWGPVDDPQFLVYVWLEKPTSSIWGSEVAAPIFRKVVERLVILMNIPPDHVRR